VAAVTTAIHVSRWRALAASPRARAGVRALVGGAILVALVAELGAEPFARGVAAVSPPAVLAAVVLGGLATLAAAARWRILADRLDVGLGWPAAVGAYYRSQFLNTILPGGVLGDVHRAVVHGRDAGSLPQASRAVAAERAAGQIVQLTLAVIVLAWLGLSASVPALLVLVGAVAAVVGAFALAAAVNRRARGAIRRELALFATALAAPCALAGVVVASVAVIACHTATFVVACLAVGVDAPVERLAAVALLAVLAGSIPVNIGGWGPREGAAAWAFAAIGLGGAAGLAASTAFGVLAMIAVLPGAAVIAASALRRRRIAVGAFRKEPT
jgi:uncharacterized membrane protein YbhN (UPF0104 family)